jgi:hypothetical protein
MYQTETEAVAAAVRMNQVDPRMGWRAAPSRTRQGWWTIVAH